MSKYIRIIICYGQCKEFVSSNSNKPFVNCAVEFSKM